LVRGFSHDVKNPIGAADSHAALLEDGTLGHLDERQLEGVRRIRSSLRSALSLIDDLVAFARTDAGDVEIIREPTDVRVIVHDLREEYRAQAEAAGLDIEIEPPPALNPIPTDAGRVRRILGNLVSNAVKYTPRGGHITLRVTTRDSGPYGEGGRWIAVDVVDPGPGIPKAQPDETVGEVPRLQPGAAAGHGSRHTEGEAGGDLRRVHTPTARRRRRRRTRPRDQPPPRTCRRRRHRRSKRTGPRLHVHAVAARGGAAGATPAR